MKALIISSSMVLFMIGCWVGFMFYTENTSEVLSSSMKEVYENSYDENWDGALAACDDFLDIWKSDSRIYSLYMESVCVHDIELSAKRCRAYVKAHNRPMALGESASILAHISLMQESDRLSFINIF